jgi:hypothetical protein
MSIISISLLCVPVHTHSDSKSNNTCILLKILTGLHAEIQTCFYLHIQQSVGHLRDEIVHYHIHKSSQLSSVLCHVNPVYIILPTYLTSILISSSNPYVCVESCPMAVLHQKSFGNKAWCNYHHIYLSQRNNCKEGKALLLLPH